MEESEVSGLPWLLSGQGVGMGGTHIHQEDFEFLPKPHCCEVGVGFNVSVASLDPAEVRGAGDLGQNVRRMSHSISRAWAGSGRTLLGCG